MEIRLDHVSKTFPPGVEALRDVSLTVAAGEWLVLVGPSGCGKTTLLRTIAGLETPTAGTVQLGGVDVTRTPPDQRQVAMLFQRPALLPGQTVRQNLAWTRTLQQPEPWHSLKRLVGIDPLTSEQKQRIVDVARLLGLEGVLDRPAGQLSGGQQQRVALGRALLRQANVVLLDEPLAHLDPPLRSQLRRDIRLLYARLPATILYVTHDPAEALSLGERIAVLHHGTLRQLADPSIIRERPADRFVAEWFAAEHGGISFLDGRLDERTFVGPLGRWPVPPAWPALPAEITLGIRGRDVRVNDESTAGEIQLRMSAVLEEFGPGGPWVIGETEYGRLIGRRTTESRVTGQTVTMTFSLTSAFCFDRGTGATLVAPTG